MIPIYIPSRGRADQLRTPDVLPPDWAPWLRIVVRADEVDAYRVHHPDLTYLVLPPEAERDVGTTRQWILDNAEHRWHAQWDDDFMGLNFKPTGTKRVHRTYERSDWAKALAVLLEWLESGIGMVCMSDREGAWFSPLDFVDNMRMSQTLIFDRDLARQHNCRFDRVPIMVDLDMALQMLATGHGNRGLLQWCFNHRPEDASGGCGLYRTDALKKEVGHRMEQLHPGLTKVVEKVKYGRTYYTMRTNWRLANARGKGLVLL